MRFCSKNCVPETLQPCVRIVRFNVQRFEGEDDEPELFVVFERREDFMNHLYRRIWGFVKPRLKRAESLRFIYSKNQTTHDFQNSRGQLTVMRWCCSSQNKMRYLFRVGYGILYQ